MSEPRIALRGLRKRFDTGTAALDGIDLDVADGEFVAIVGPSGCGKTTLLRIAAGLETASAGEVRVRSGDASAGRAAAAVVFQERALFPWMRVRENVAFAFDGLRVAPDERDRRVADVLDRVGLSSFAHAFPRELSGGMQQRVAVARAFVVNPDVLFMDEPFGSLDEQTRVTLGAELASLWESTRKTVLFVTHSIEEALVLSDRIVILGAAPARVREIVAVPFPRLRDAIELRADPAFGALAVRIWHALRPAAVETP